MTIPLTVDDLLPIITASAACFIVGSLWYSPLLFATVWLKETGLNAKKMQAGMARGMAIGIVGILVQVTFVALALKAVPTLTMQNALFTMLLIWMGFIMTKELGRVAWEQKSWTLFGINTVYDLAQVFVSAAIIAAWPR